MVGGLARIPFQKGSGKEFDLSIVRMEKNNVKERRYGKIKYIQNAFPFQKKVCVVLVDQLVWCDTLPGTTGDQEMDRNSTMTGKLNHSLKLPFLMQTSVLHSFPQNEAYHLGKE